MKQYPKCQILSKKINHILVEVIVHVRVQKILQCDYSLVYTNSNESVFRRFFVFGTRFPCLLSIITLAGGGKKFVHAVSQKPIRCRKFILGRDIS